jgi:hypothetical protein
MDFIGTRGHILNGFWSVGTMYNTGSVNYTQAVNMGLYDHATFVLMEAAGGAGTATITMEACTTAAGAAATALAFSYRLCTTQDIWGARVTLTATTGYLTLAGANKMVAVEMDAAELTTTKPYLRMALTVGVATAVVAGVIIILTDARYPGAVPQTAIT